jgi:WD40 repeat protein
MRPYWWRRSSTILFNPEGNLLASTSWDGTVQLWDSVGGRPLVTTHGGHVQPIQFSADGRRLAFTVGASTLSFWEVITPLGYRTLHSYRERGKGPWSADFSPDGRLLVSAHSDGVRLWDVFAGREIAFIDQRQPGLPLGYISSVIVHPNGKSFITCAPGDPKESMGVDLWPIESDHEVAAGRLRIGPPQRIDLPEGTKPEWASLGADGRTLLVADQFRGQVIVLHLHDSSQKLLFREHLSIAFVTISQNGQWIASATWQGNPNRVRVSDVRKPGAKPRELLSESGRVSAALARMANGW